MCGCGLVWPGVCVCVVWSDVVVCPWLRSLVTIKRITQTGTVRLEFAAPAVGGERCKLFLMCDSYTGCDQEFDIPLSVAGGDDNDDGGASDGGNDMEA